MTTGRINQVATIRNAVKRLNAVLLAPSRVFSLGRSSSTGSKEQTFKPIKVRPYPQVHLPPWGVQASPTIHDQTTLSLDLTKFKHTSPCPLQTAIVAFGGDYQRPTAPERHATVTADPRVVYLTDRFSHRQVIHILLLLQALITKVRNLAEKDLECSKALDRSGRLFQVSIP